MSRKLKKLARSVSEKSGVSYAGAVNLLRRGAPRVGDDVEFDRGGSPVRGTVVYILPPSGIPGVPRPGKNIFLVSVPSSGGREHLYLPRSVLRPLPPSDPCVFGLFLSGGVPPNCLPIYEKDPGEAFYYVGEEGDCVYAVTRPRKVVIPLFEVRSDLVDADGNVLGQDLPVVRRILRERMEALLDAAALNLFGDRDVVVIPRTDAAGVSARLGTSVTWFMSAPPGGCDGKVLSEPPPSGRLFCGPPLPGVIVREGAFRYGLFVRSSRIFCITLS